jgi:hypothetical protein
MRLLVRCVAGMFLLAACAAVAVAAVMAGPAPAATRPAVISKAQWQAEIARVPEPGTGCYRASYPALQWNAVKCATAPGVPLLPAPPRTRRYRLTAASRMACSSTARERHPDRGLPRGRFSHPGLLVAGAQAVGHLPPGQYPLRLAGRPPEGEAVQHQPAVPAGSAGLPDRNGSRGRWSARFRPHRDRRMVARQLSPLIPGNLRPAPLVLGR